MGDAVRPIGQFLIGALPPVADQRDTVAKATLYHAVAQFHAHIQPIGIVKDRRNFGPFRRSGQPVAGEGVVMARWS